MVQRKQHKVLYALNALLVCAFPEATTPQSEFSTLIGPMPEGREGALLFPLPACLSKAFHKPQQCT